MASKKKPAETPAPAETADAPADEAPAAAPIDRIGALEKAIGATLGVDIRQFDPPDVVAARQQIVADAEAAAADAVDAAKAEAEALELTDEQRLDRIERAARSAGLTL